MLCVPAGLEHVAILQLQLPLPGAVNAGVFYRTQLRKVRVKAGGKVLVFTEKSEAQSPASQKQNRGSGGETHHTPLVPALWRQGRADLCESKASLGYRTSSRTAKAM